MEVWLNRDPASDPYTTLLNFFMHHTFYAGELCKMLVDFLLPWNHKIRKNCRWVPGILKSPSGFGVLKKKKTLRKREKREVIFLLHSLTLLLTPPQTLSPNVFMNEFYVYQYYITQHCHWGSRRKKTVNFIHKKKA